MIEKKGNEFVGYVYGLYDPRTDELRYVGQTIKSLEKRLSIHIYQCKNIKNHKCNWIKSLLELNLSPVIKGIEVVNSASKDHLNRSLIDREVIIISENTSTHNLTNLTNGGEGCFGYKHTEEDKQKISKLLKGRKYSEETKKKIGEKSKGRYHTELTKQKISNSLKGDKNSFYGKKHSEETRKKISENHHDVKAENNPSSKLTWGIINEVRDLYLNGVIRKDIVRSHNIPNSTLGSILQNRSWVCSDYGKKLSELKPNVNDIRNLYLNGYSTKELINMFQLPKGTLTKIVSNKTWRNDGYQLLLNKKRGL